MNDGESLGWYSEEGLETSNKDKELFGTIVMKKVVPTSKLRMPTIIRPLLDTHNIKIYDKEKLCSQCVVNYHTIGTRYKHLTEGQDNFCDDFHRNLTCILQFIEKYRSMGYRLF